MNRHELLAIVEDAWRRLDTAIEGLDEAALVEPGVVESWSIKDLIGHVTAWERMALRHVEQTRGGEMPTPLDVDDYNTREAVRRRDWPLPQVLDESVETRQRLRTMLESMSDEEWSSVIGEGERKGPLGDWVGGAMGGPTGPGTHAVEHAEHIQAWRAARGETASV